MISPVYKAQVDLLLQVLPYLAKEEMFEAGEPDWDLFPLPVLKDLPAIQWKLLAIDKLKTKNPDKHTQKIEALKSTLDF